MFFIKHHGKRVDLAEHEVYTYCPQCGKVQELPDFDLFSTAVYCRECSKKNADCR